MGDFLRLLYWALNIWVCSIGFDQLRRAVALYPHRNLASINSDSILNHLLISVHVNQILDARMHCGRSLISTRRLRRLPLVP